MAAPDGSRLCGLAPRISERSTVAFRCCLPLASDFFTKTFGLPHSRKAELIKQSVRLTGHFISEDVLQSELHDSRILGGSNLTKVTSAQICYRIIEIGMVDNIERLGSQFQSLSLI